MITISSKANLITLINVFTVEPGKPAPARWTSNRSDREFSRSGAGFCFCQPPSQYRRHKGDDVCAVAQYR
jgi:hypothetical protein